MILHYPNDALERLEEVSYLLKNGKDLNEFLKIEDIRTYKQVA
jgi:hypothetical protein